MMLVDAGPLVSILRKDDQDHDRCARVLPEVDSCLLTTWPAFSEAMYLLDCAVGWPAQEALWTLHFRGDLAIAEMDESLIKRAFDLMFKYRDLPMDLADATLVAVAEHRKLNRIFTLDKDFRVYRLHGRQAFEIVP